MNCTLSVLVPLSFDKKAALPLKQQQSSEYTDLGAHNKSNMKSKPVTKKIKLEPSATLPSGDGGPSGSRTGSPAGSTTSSTSSLLSIPPPTGNSSSLKSGADMASVAKAVTSSMAKAALQVQQQQQQQQQGSGGGGMGGVPLTRNASSPPAYPTYVHTDVKEWPRMNVLINCPRSSDGKASVTLGPEGIMTMDDLDALQAELETLWSAMACRIRSLKVDQATLQNSSSTVNVTTVLGEHFDPHHQEKINAVASLIDAGHGTRSLLSAAAKLVMGSQTGGGASGSGGTSATGATSSSSAASSGLVSASKKTAATSGTTPKREDKLPKKKLKGEAGSMMKKGSDKPARATQNRSHSVSSDFGGLDGFYKHEAPNEFWEFADNYCGEITQEHLEDLTKVIDEYKSLPEALFEIPPLGKHFKDGDTEAGSSKAKSEGKISKRIDACGPLTQRLVSALVDERVAMHHNQRHVNSPGSQKEENGNGHEHGFVHRTGLIKALGLDGGPNRPPMESQLRECLLERGFLHPEDANDPMLFNPDDEILVEIRRTQNTLKKLHDYNSERLQELHNKATRQLERSILKEELDDADKEVIEAYKAIVSLKQKKKPVTKREKDAALKALEMRDKALQKLSPSSRLPPTGDVTAPTSALKVEV